MLWVLWVLYGARKGGRCTPRSKVCAIRACPTPGAREQVERSLLWRQAVEPEPGEDPAAEAGAELRFDEPVETVEDAVTDHAAEIDEAITDVGTDRPLADYLEAVPGLTEKLTGPLEQLLTEQQRADAQGSR